jgi:hypothetical protein
MPSAGGDGLPEVDEVLAATMLSRTRISPR